MSKNAFDKIMRGLVEAEAHLRGDEVPGLRVQHRDVSRSGVASLRLKMGLTQAGFAKLIGASAGTLRKWESGERMPSGASARLLHLLAAEPEIVTRVLGIEPAVPMRRPRSGLAAE